MSGWDDTPTGAADSGWQADTSTGPSGDGFANGGISEENISKHANGADGPADGGCRLCHQDDHFARDCPDKGDDFGACFNCGETGHNKADCTNPAVEREFTGACNFCGQSGHRARDCAEKPPDVCRICNEEGHIASACDANRMIAALKNMGIQDMPAEVAWKLLEEADREKDVDDIRTAILSYAKAYPEVTFEELEGVFRDMDLNTHLIGKKQEVSDTHTIVNLQGKQDQEFVVSIQFSSQPRRAKFAEGWPTSPEENLSRLAKAGFPMDRMVQKCSNCDQLGHGSRACPEEKVEREKMVISCANCNNEGHRARDCPEPRKTGKKGCRNCGSEEHIAKECPEPPNPENVECKNCGTMGHFSRDCPDREPELCRNCNKEGHRAKDCTEERVIICRNCDAEGHVSRECPKPTDWSRVECSNCHQKGHSYKRCKEPAADAGEETTGDFGASAGDGGDSWGAGGDTTASGGW